MKRRPGLAPTPRAVEITPRLRGEDLPPLYPEPPSGGWTLDTTAAIAWEYANAHALGRSGARAAFQALATHFDPTLHRAEIRARFAGNVLFPHTP